MKNIALSVISILCLLSVSYAQVERAPKRNNSRPKVNKKIKRFSKNPINSRNITYINDFSAMHLGIKKMLRQNYIPKTLITKGSVNIFYERGGIRIQAEDFYIESYSSKESLIKGIMHKFQKGIYPTAIDSENGVFIAVYIEAKHYANNITIIDGIFPSILLKIKAFWKKGYIPSALFKNGRSFSVVMIKPLKRFAHNMKYERISISAFKMRNASLTQKGLSLSATAREGNMINALYLDRTTKSGSIR